MSDYWSFEHLTIPEESSRLEVGCSDLWRLESVTLEGVSPVCKYVFVNSQTRLRFVLNCCSNSRYLTISSKSSISPIYKQTSWQLQLNNQSLRNKSNIVYRVCISWHAESSILHQDYQVQ